MISESQLTGTILAGPGQRQRWDSFVASHPNGHLLQSFAWGDFKRRHQWPAMRVVITEQGNDRILAGAQVLFREMAGLSVAYIPKGPVVDWSDRPLVEALFRTLRQVTKRRRAIYLKIEPEHLEDPQFASFLQNELDFRVSDESVQPRSTIRVNLQGKPEEWLERMKPKTRYNIRLAERRGVTCRQADPANPADFEAFYKLMETTGQRDSFGIHSAAYYKDAWLTFYNSPAGSGSGALWLAEYNGKVIAGVMVFAFGQESAYLYGASSDENRREMPTYLLQWKAMLWAKEQGAAWYDFWGIPEEIGNLEEEPENEKLEQKNVRDGLWGVYRFKQGFGGEVVRYAGAYDLVYNRAMYLLWQRMQRLRASR
ncbi:MAG TPA: peptidoglycan bridge formation glycyltransferase FemA/FemB family protein [Chloroflexia bacterium]|nr:peptidoglycan bridge formation glycyltransferase FemA/FemB family protein [Chloroflexia bacterium]